GIDFAERSDPAGRRVAFLFPGQGAQRPEMLGELAVAFPEIRRAFEAIDAALRTLGRPVIGPKVFPPPGFDEGERARQGAALADPEVAQPALAAASVGLLRLLESLGVRPEVFAGHSYGELVALHAAGAFSVEALAELSEARGRFLKAAVGDEPGAMAALVVGPEQVAAILDGLEGVAAVNWNGPSQTVISGTRAAVAEAVERARRAGVRGQVLPVACAFHSPLVAGAREPLATLASLIGMKPPRLPIFSNVTAAPYPAEVDAIAAQLGDHLTRPVRFAEMVEAMHADGARIFVEVGPGAALTGMVGSILGDRPHLAVACEPPGQRGLPGLLMTLGRLLVAGVPLRLDRLTAGRAARRLDPTRFTAEPDAEPLPPSAWLVNGSRARPASGPEPARLGVGPALPAPGPALSRNGTAHAPHKNGTVLPEFGARPLTSAASGPSDGVERAFVEFQKTMQAFLEVQRTAMLTLLTGQGAPDLPSRPLPIEGEPDLLRRAPAAPPARVEPAPPKPVSAPERLGREELAARLLAIVRERTGYPAEMLRLDLDLEADLGIDSIKRVEILGSLREALPSSAFGSDSEMMDQLSRARTLGAIVDRLARALDAIRPCEAATGPPKPPAPARGQAHEPDARVRRLTLEAVAAPLPRCPRGTGLMAGGLVLVTDDRQGVARAVAADLRAKGHPVIRVGHGSAPLAGPGETVECSDLTSPAEVAALLDRVRGLGPLAGIVHALPLREMPPAGLDPQAWSSRLGPEVRGLFLLARASADDLARAAGRGGACLIAATAMGGGFATAGQVPADFFPGHGAVAGLVKTLAREWPRSVRVRVVDLDPLLDVELLAADLVQEVEARDGCAEVGYVHRRRMVLRAVEAALPDSEGLGVALAPGEPLLITGGARGITAAVAADLARRWRPTLLLVGTSPLPSKHEDPATHGVTAPGELKAILHQALARGEAQVSPTELERAYQALRRQREIRENLKIFQEAGATVEYARADVRDAETMRRVLDRWRERFGP
ncbi:MAG: acyltransferase domain-containing protein, partial [Planctomycetaceae bacterium]|nr:acyltransferase domain-containing protein [Planctomycetaceae bacterium]